MDGGGGIFLPVLRYLSSDSPSKHHFGFKNIKKIAHILHEIYIMNKM